MHNKAHHNSCNYYDEIYRIVQDGLSDIDLIAKEICSNTNAKLIPDVMDYLSSMTGKRIRPMLALFIGKVLDVDFDKTVFLAAAIESIHTATLLHDDVIDGSIFRRGMAVTHSIWGNKTSILVGDYLLSQAFSLLVKTSSIDALEMVASTAIKITEAELYQIQLIGNYSYTVDEYITVIKGKTAFLFAASTASACFLSEASGRYSNDLYEYGMNLGIIFQITDDILDYFGNPDEFGKVIGGDFAEKKVTLPIIILYQFASMDEKSMISNYFADINASSVNINEVLSLMGKYDVYTKSKAFMEEYIVNAANALKRIALVDKYYINILNNLLQLVVNRCV